MKWNKMSLASQQRQQEELKSISLDSIYSEEETALSSWIEK